MLNLMLSIECFSAAVISAVFDPSSSIFYNFYFFIFYIFFEMQSSIISIDFSEMFQDSEAQIHSGIFNDQLNGISVCDFAAQEKKQQMRMTMPAIDDSNK